WFTLGYGLVVPHGLSAGPRPQRGIDGRGYRILNKTHRTVGQGEVRAGGVPAAEVAAPLRNQGRLLKGRQGSEVRRQREVHGHTGAVQNVAGVAGVESPAPVMQLVAGVLVVDGIVGVAF